MSRRRYNSAMYAPNIQSYWASCSIDTKNKINEFLIERMEYKKDEMVPIIIQGTRPFSIYKYSKDNESLNMIVLTREGIRQLCILCNESDSRKDISIKLLKYFNTYLTEKYSKELEMFKKMIPYLVQHYIEYRNRQCYDLDKSVGRCICFVNYPTDSLASGISACLNGIILSGDDSIVKSKLKLDEK